MQSSKLKALSTCSAQLGLANIIIQKSSLPHLLGSQFLRRAGAFEAIIFAEYIHDYQENGKDIIIDQPIDAIDITRVPLSH